MNQPALKHIVEAALMAAEAPMTINQLATLFEENERPEAKVIRDAINELQQDCETRAVELKEVASGYRYQAKQEYAPWLKKLWEERPQRYTRAFLETLVLIAYRQPITRAEIEEIRGVAVNSQIIKTLAEREWIKVLGHKDVPGKPALLGTTKQFLDYFNLKNLSELPNLQEIQDLDAKGSELEKQLQLDTTIEQQISAEAAEKADALVQEVEADSDEKTIEQEVFSQQESA